MPETQSVQEPPILKVKEELVAILRRVDLSLNFGKEITDENVVIDQDVLDTSLERLFPAIRITSSGGAIKRNEDLGAPSMTLPSHRRRRHLYNEYRGCFAGNPSAS